MFLKITNAIGLYTENKNIFVLFESKKLVIPFTDKDWVTLQDAFMTDKKVVNLNEKLIVPITEKPIINLKESDFNEPL